MPNSLKGLQIVSADLCPEGCNQDADICLFKRHDPHSAEPATVNHPAENSQGIVAKLTAAIAGACAQLGLTPAAPVAKEAQTFGDEMYRERLREVTGESWSMAYALNDSLTSIICDDDLTEDAKRAMMLTSLEEFTATARNAIPNWAKGERAETGGPVIKSQAAQAAFDAYWAIQYSESAPPPAATTETNTVGKAPNQKKEETDTMKIDMSKMTAEEQATLAEFEKKYGIAEPTASPAVLATGTGDGGVAKGAEPSGATAAGGASATPELHPEVKKALDEAAKLRKAQDAKIEELTKSLEIKDLTAVAKKYEIIGKKADELAPKLYELKKAGGTAYDDTIALLDEQLALVEKSGLFGEVGHNTSGGIGAGGELDAKAAEIQKANTGMSHAEAFAKAYETYPDLAAQYEKTYTGRA